MLTGHTCADMEAACASRTMSRSNEMARSSSDSGRALQSGRLLHQVMMRPCMYVCRMYVCMYVGHRA